KTEPGLHLVTWDLSGRVARTEAERERERGGAESRPESRGGRREAAAEEGGRPRRNFQGGGRRRGEGGAGRAEGAARAASSPETTTQPTATRPSSRPGGRRPGGPQGPGGFRGGRPVPLGVYRVILEVDGKDWEKVVRVEGDPTLPPEIAAIQGTQEEEEGIE